METSPSPEMAVRHVLARLAAERCGRSVPAQEIARALASRGLGEEETRAQLAALEARRLAFRRGDGWLPGSPPTVARVVLAHAQAARLAP